jgi:predicted 3-demethylubiquinone-9 3-methyltransferase (glyoxalase superfamily)
VTTQISTCLWFDGRAEEAANFYVSIFPNSKILKTARYPEGAPGPSGSVMTIEFELDGRKFLGLNGGPHFKFNEAISFIISCQTQEEVDRYWQALTAGGGEVQCGWVKDKFGVSWQVVPTALGELLSDPDAHKAKRVMQAMMGMKKLDIRGLQQAAAGG